MFNNEHIIALAYEKCADRKRLITFNNLYDLLSAHFRFRRMSTHTPANRKCHATHRSHLANARGARIANDTDARDRAASLCYGSESAAAMVASAIRFELGVPVFIFDGTNCQAKDAEIRRTFRVHGASAM